MIEKDKVLHFLGCFAIAEAATVAIPLWAAAGLALAVGVAKELYDSRQDGNYFSWGDIVADVLGIALAVVLLSA